MSDTLSQDAALRALDAWNVSLAHARAVIECARTFASEQGFSVASVVVDSAGHPVAAERMDGAPYVALELAQEKAWTAAAFGAPTTAWSDSSQPGRRYWGLTNALRGRFSVLAGGAPLKVDGRLVGAVGISGGDDEQDHACATHAAALGRAS